MSTSCAHILPLAILTIDWVMNRVEHPLKFSLWFIPYMIIYAIQSIVAQIMNGKALYAFMDWSSPMAPVALAAIGLVLIIMYYSLFGLS